jgi:nucleoside-diphosphate-sugar epimerase
MRSWRTRARIRMTQREVDVSILSRTRSRTTGPCTSTETVRVLLTGAAGFVGSRVARVLLARGHEVHAVVRGNHSSRRLRDLTGIRLLRGDVVDEKDIRELVVRAAPETCIHCAWVATPGEYLTSPDNALHETAAEHLGRALIENGCGRIVALGTCFEYAPSDAPHEERSLLGPSTVYARAKLAAYQRLTHICEGTRTSLAWARLFYLFGPHEDPRRLVPSVTLALLEGRAAATTAGEQLRDFLHVDDVATALATIAESRVIGPVNVASGRPVTVRDVVLHIGVLTGRPDLLKLGALPYAAGDPMAVTADVTKLAACGFTPERTLDEGLAETVRWWSERSRR